MLRYSLALLLFQFLLVARGRQQFTWPNAGGIFGKKPLELLGTVARRVCLPFGGYWGREWYLSDL